MMKRCVLKRLPHPPPFAYLIVLNHQVLCIERKKCQRSLGPSGFSPVQDKTSNPTSWQIENLSTPKYYQGSCALAANTTCMLSQTQIPGRLLGSEKMPSLL